MGTDTERLGSGIAMVNFEEIISQPKRNASSYAELSPWYCNVGSNLILTVDGMLLAGFQFDGMDVDGKTDSEINRQLDMLEYSLNILDDKTVVYSYIDRRKGFKPEKSLFNNWYAEEVHKQLLKKQNQNYTTFKHTFFIGYKQQELSQSLFSKIIAYADEEDNIIKATAMAMADVWTGRGSVSSVKRQFGELHETFEGLLSSFTSMIGNVISVRRLSGEDLNGELFRRANPASIDGPIKVPKNNWFLPSRMASDTMVRDGGSIKFIGPTQEKHINVLSIVEEPEEVSSIHVDALLDVEAEFTLCQTFQILETETVKKLIQSHEMYYRSEVKDIVTRIAERVTNQVIEKENHGFSVLADEAQQALIDITTRNKKYGYHSTRLLIYSDDEDTLRTDTGKVATMLRKNGYSLTAETTGLFAAFLSTLPGNSKVNPRKYLASVEKVADMMPLRGKYEGQPLNKHFSEKLNRPVACHILFDTYSNIPYQFNFHVGDVGHGLIIGGTGAGKTTLMNLVISEHQKFAPAKTYIFDKDYSMAVPSLLLGGKHIDGSKPNSLSTNPLKRFLADNDLNTAAKWINILLESGGDKLTGTEKELLSASLMKMQASGEASWNLAMFYTLVRGVNQSLAQKIQPYVDTSDNGSISGRGIFSGYFDAIDDAYAIADIMCFECTKIIKMEEIAPAFLFYVTYCIEKGLDGSTPTLIFIEECWHYFKNPSFADILEDWARTLRKKLAYLVMVTQGAKEFDAIPCGEVIVSLCPTKIFLPLITDMNVKEMERYQSLFGVNEEEFLMIRQAIPKKDYVIKQPGITKLVISKMPELTLASNDACAVEKARNRAFELAQEDGVNWIRTYIKDVMHVSVQ